MEYLKEFGGLLLAILGLIVSVIWIMVPFAVFGIKQRLDKMLELMAFTNQRLTKIAGNSPTPSRRPSPPRQLATLAIQCPSCGRNFEVIDKPGVDSHTCPHCTQVVSFQGAEG